MLGQHARRRRGIRVAAAAAVLLATDPGIDDEVGPARDARERPRGRVGMQLLVSVSCEPDSTFRQANRGGRTRRRRSTLIAREAGGQCPGRLIDREHPIR